MGQISLDSSVEISDDAIFREMDGEAVILNLESGTYFGLDPVGTRIWQLLEQDGSLRVVFGRMRQEFDVEPEVLEIIARVNDDGKPILVEHAVQTQRELRPPYPAAEREHRSCLSVDGVGHRNRS